jgi:hypothetical protein
MDGVNPNIAFVHIHSMRSRSGAEVLVARLVTTEGRMGYGFSFALDPEEARRMAAWNAGAEGERPRCSSSSGHLWETAWMESREIDWHCEPGFGALQWINPPSEPPR